MSLQFNDTSTFKGLVQMYEREIGATRGDVSGNTNRLKEFAADVNLAFDSYLRMAFPVDGTWKLDDSNHTDMPEITTNLVAGQRRYTFTEDESGNLLLDIFAVYIKNGTSYEQITPVDPDTEPNLYGFYDGLNTQGRPSYYDKTANVIILDPVPETSVADGLKVSINREASYFTYTDTTKKPGVPGTHHAYFYLKPAEQYARIENLSSHDRIAMALLKIEDEIKAHYARRSRDQRSVFTGRRINFK